ncbi:hypothetical protein [Actinomyces israelii]|uniref:hypothetical protein n=1 Tax=Actinomyces israelii TaxID=1659 RepID=UPI0025564E17|nr:hypothetical protein [Actinomyces israelii]WKR21148.1 hypothetical protein AIF0345_1047 [Actinomyces israelii]
MMTSRRAFLTSAAATVVGATLTACSQELPPAPAVGTPTAHSVLDSTRFTTVLERIQTGLDAADAAKDAKLLSGYLTGPAQRVRTEEYTLASAAKDDSKIEHFTTQSQAGTAGLTTGFPRIALAVTDAEEDKVPYLLAMTQNGARDNFELWAWVQPFVPVSIPETTAVSAGSEQVDGDTDGLLSTPQQVLDAYIDALNNPDGDNGKTFADDPLRQQLASLRSKDVSVAGEITVAARGGSDGFRGVRTKENGAIVFTTITYDVVYKRTVAKSTLKMPADVASLLGTGTEIAGEVATTNDVMMAFSIPPAEPTEASGNQPVLLGQSRVLASASKDDSKSPG